MEWPQMLISAFLLTSCLCLINAANTEENVSPKENITSSSYQNNGNKTDATAETLDEAPSENIKFKQPLIFREVNRIPFREVSAVKDIAEEEKHFTPVPSERTSRTFLDAPPHKEQTRYSQPLILATEPRAIPPRPAADLADLDSKYSRSEYSEEGSAPWARYRGYSGDNRGPSYPDSREESDSKTYTETNDDVGKFLPEDYRTKIEKDAEAMIKSSKNSTSSKKLETSEEAHTPRVRKPEHYNRNREVVYQDDPHNNPPKNHNYHNFHRDKGPGSKTFFFLGKEQPLRYSNQPERFQDFKPPEYQSTPQADSRGKSPIYSYSHGQENTRPPATIKHQGHRRPLSAGPKHQFRAYDDKPNCSSKRNPNANSQYYDVPNERYPNAHSTGPYERPIIDESSYYSTSELDQNEQLRKQQSPPITHHYIDTPQDGPRSIDHSEEKTDLYQNDNGKHDSHQFDGYSPPTVPANLYSGHSLETPPYSEYPPPNAPVDKYSGYSPTPVKSHSEYQPPTSPVEPYSDYPSPTIPAKPYSGYPPSTSLAKPYSGYPPSTSPVKPYSEYPPSTSLTKPYSDYPPSAPPAKPYSDHPSSVPPAKLYSEYPPSTSPAKPYSEYPPSTSPVKPYSEYPPSTSLTKPYSDYPPSAPPAKPYSDHPSSVPPAKPYSEYPPSTSPAKPYSEYPPSTSPAKPYSEYPPSTSPAKPYSEYPPSTSPEKTQSDYSPIALDGPEYAPMTAPVEPFSGYDPPATPFSGYSLPPMSQPHYVRQFYPEPYDGSDEEDPQQKFYETYRSVMDLYRSFGFPPLEPGRVVQMYDARFQVGSPFRAKIPIVGMSSIEHPVTNTKVPRLIEQITSNPNQDTRSSESSLAIPEGNYNRQNNGQKTINGRPSPQQYYPINNPKNTFQLEHVPHDSNQSPTVSIEHQDSSMSKPATFNSQRETSEGYFLQNQNPAGQNPTENSARNPLDEVRTFPIKIRDVNPDYYEKPTEKEMNTGPDTAPPHTIVRNNPYQTPSNNNESEGRIYKERPRNYGGQGSINSNYQNNIYKSNVIDAPKDALSSYSPALRETKHSKPTNPMVFETKFKKGKEALANMEKEHKRDREDSKKQRPQYTVGDTIQDDQRSNVGVNSKRLSNKKKEKKSSHLRPRKHKHLERSENRDQMKVAASAQKDWLKSSNGFFQYANVPGAETYQYGYRLGGQNHTEEKHHQTNGIQSKIKMVWKNKNGDTGDHYWEFNHTSKENSD